MLPVGDGHTIYWEQCGNPEGKPIVFLHGGPGSGCTPTMRRFFDPAVYRIVLFDQRGCGRSTPYACLENNTTWHLVADMELLRAHLAIDKWVVFGGSWGSTLALAYAEKHAAAVKALVLRGIFTLRRDELLFFYQKGADMLYPDAWEHYLAPIPEEERGDLMAAYHKRLTSEDEAVRLEAAKAWSVWEGCTSKLTPDPSYVATFEDPALFVSFARIENHYFVHNGWFEPEQLIKGIEAVRAAGIPGVIVQGRYDIVCPMRTAWDLHRAWPEADFKLVPDAGHSAYEPGIQRELLDATDRFRDL